MTPDERRFEDARDRFVALVENSEEFVAMAELNGTVLYVNAAGRRLVGLEFDDDVTTTRMPDYLPRDRIADAAVLLAKRCATAGGAASSSTGISKPGSASPSTATRSCWWVRAAAARWPR